MTTGTMPRTDAQGFSIKRLLPLLVLLAVPALAWVFGLNRLLTFDLLAQYHGTLKAWVADHQVLSVIGYTVFYAASTALSLPAGLLITVTGGLLFGWLVGGTATVIGATIGATGLFLVAKTSLGAGLAKQAGPWLEKLSEGFRKDAFNYLLFLRLVPAFPFFAVNAVAGLTRMPLRTFAWGTLIGIIPGSFAFAWLGRGLGSIIDAQTTAHAACVAETSAVACPYTFAVSSLVTPQILWALAGLGLVSLLPVLLKRWKSQS